ncbi:MAG: peptidoglycan DD-metalloendopeptidase family protein [Lachnospiraceae bacterium]|nr:peptidoglycan DD-metalloendopeptidase family protein [Lachnospiraceae bacterium]
MKRKGKSKLTVLAMLLSFVLIETQGVNTKASTPETDVVYRWPVPSSHEILNYYGEGNSGIDIISDKTDAEVVAARGGIVSAAESTACEHIDNYPEYCCNNGLGNYVRIEHEDGTYAMYENLKYGSVTVENGQKVEEGEVIGIMGSSGRSECVHLHFALAYSPTETINTNPESLNYKYPKEKAAANETTVQEATNQWTIDNEDGVNLRDGAGTGYNKIGYIEAGTTIEVTDIIEGEEYKWGKTVYDGIEGWCVLNYATQVVKDVVIKEKEETLRCTLKLETLGGDVSYSTYVYAKGEQFGKLPNAKKDGYKFLGWYTDETYATEYNPKHTINKDTTFYAKWEKKSVEGQ